jgi:hypothetical protein
MCKWVILMDPNVWEPHSSSFQENKQIAKQNPIHLLSQICQCYPTINLLAYFTFVHNDIDNLQ